MKPPEEILPLGFAYLDRCASIFAAAFSEEPWNQPWTTEAARERLKEILDTRNLWAWFVCARTARSSDLRSALPANEPTARRSSWTSWRWGRKRVEWA